MEPLALMPPSTFQMGNVLTKIPFKIGSTYGTTSINAATGNQNFIDLPNWNHVFNLIGLIASVNGTVSYEF